MGMNESCITEQFKPCFSIIKIERIDKNEPLRLESRLSGVVQFSLEL